MQRYSVWQDDLGYIKQEPMEDGEWVLYSDAQSRISTLEAALRDLLNMRETHERIYGMEKQHYIIQDNEQWQNARQALGDL